MEQDNLSPEEEYLPTRILCPTKLSFKLNREIRIFQDKEKLKHFMSTKPTLQRILKGIIHVEEN
jgi:hypothetical protein